MKPSIKHVKFGEHLIFDAYNCNFDKLNSMEFCYKLLNKMVEIAEMHKLIEPVVIDAGGNEVLGGKDPGGFSGFVIIQESHISVHTFPKRGFVTLDVYSCKQFDAQKIIEFLNEELEPKEADIIKLDRGLKYPTENIYE